MLFKLGWRTWGGIVAIVIFISLLPRLRPNILGIMINRTLSRDHVEAETRQHAISGVTTLLQPFNTVDEKPEMMAMIPSIVQGISHYRSGDIKTAVSWFEQASRTSPYPAIQKKITISPFVEINSDNSFTLSGSSSWWRVRFDSNKDSSIQKQTNSGVFLCAPNANPQKAVFEGIQSIDTVYHHKATLEARTDVGTILALFTVSNNELVRQFVHVGTGKIEELEFAFNGDKLDFIYISINKKEDPIQNSSCRSEIYSITFFMDDQVQ